MAHSKKVSIGLDISDDSVRMVRLRETRKGPKLIGFGIAELPPIMNGERKRVVSKAIRNLLSQERINGQRIVASLSGPGVHIQRATFPSLTSEKLKEAIRWKLKDTAPFDLDDTILDYAVMDKVGQNGSTKLETIAVAAKKDAVKDKVE